MSYVFVEPISLGKYSVTLDEKLAIAQRHGRRWRVVPAAGHALSAGEKKSIRYMMEGFADLS
jgi:hypothetical protein